MIDGGGCGVGAGLSLMTAFVVPRITGALADVVLSDVEPDVQTRSWIVQFPDGSQAVLCQSSGGTAWLSALEDA